MFIEKYIIDISDLFGNFSFSLGEGKEVIALAT